MDRKNRAYAIFASTLETDSEPSPGEVREALRRHRDIRACVATVAYAFGDHPQPAAHRMSWALATAYRDGCTTRVPPANDDRAAPSRETVMATL